MSILSMITGLLISLDTGLLLLLIILVWVGFFEERK